MNNLTEHGGFFEAVVALLSHRAEGVMLNKALGMFGWTSCLLLKKIWHVDTPSKILIYDNPHKSHLVS